MSKKWILLSVLVIVIGGSLAAQDPPAEGGQFRMVQIFYPDSTLLVDGETLFEGLKFSFATDYFPLDAGTHTIAVTPTDSESGASLDLEVADGHNYTLVTIGEVESDAPTLLVIDETAELAALEKTGNNAIIVSNLPDAPAADVYFLDQKVIENLSFGTYGVATAPTGHFKARATLAGSPETVLFESEYFAVPSTTSLAYLAGTSPADVKRFFFTTTSMNMLDYLTAHTSLEGSTLTTLFELLQAAGLTEQMTGDTPFTLFAPTNDAFEALPPQTRDFVLNNPEALADILHYHLIPEYLPPYALDGEQALTTLQGSPLTLVHTPGESLTVNGVPTGLQHRMNNGVIYLIDTVLLPPAN